MALPTFARIEQAIRDAWAGDLPAARAVAGEHEGLIEPLELLASAPLAYKTASAAAVRAAWVRAGGETPVVPRPGIAEPIAPASRWPHR